MLNVNTEYDLFINGEFVQVVDILGAVNGVAIVLIKGNPYRFSTSTGESLDKTGMELREAEETDVGALSAYVANLAANIDNENLSDGQFRSYAKTVIKLMQESIIEEK